MKKIYQTIIQTIPRNSRNGNENLSFPEISRWLMNFLDLRQKMAVELTIYLQVSVVNSVGEPLMSTKFKKLVERALEFCKMSLIQSLNYLKLLIP